MIVVVPMAGRGSRFSNEGYNTPKPLINVGGKPMIYWSLKSLEGVRYEKIVFVALREHQDRYGLCEILTNCIGDSFELVLIDEVTEGQLCTVLMARNYFEGYKDLLVIASDSYIRSSIGKEIVEKEKDLKGIISVSNLPGEMWSFAKIDCNGDVVEVAEKQRISNNASTGIYYFSDINEFVRIADEIIANEEKIRGEYFVIPVYQKMIKQNEKVKISLAEEMWDMGTPATKFRFEMHLKQKP